MSARKYDTNGWFTVRNNPISRVGVFPYYGRDIGAPEPDRIYRVLRPAEELGKQETLDSFRLLPLVDDHTWLGDPESGGTPAEDKGVHGILGEEVSFDGRVMRGPLKIFSKALDNRLKNGKKELSCAYRCRYEFTAGEFEGEAYDAIQRDLRGNHIALVDKGRMGADVRVLDHGTFAFDAMDVELGMDPELQAALDEAGTTLAQVSDAAPDTALFDKIKMALQAALAAIEKATGVVPKEEAASEAEEKPAEDHATMTPEEQKELDDAKATADAATAAATEAKAALDAALAEVAALKRAADEAPPALDAATVMREMGARDELANNLKPHVGAFDHAGMTLAEVAKYGVGKLELEAADGQETAVLKAYLKAAPDPTKTVPGHGADAAPVAGGGLIARKLKSAA